MLDSSSHTWTFVVLRFLAVSLIFLFVSKKPVLPSQQQDKPWLAPWPLGEAAVVLVIAWIGWHVLEAVFAFLVGFTKPSHLTSLSGESNFLALRMLLFIGWGTAVSITLLRSIRLKCNGWHPFDVASQETRRWVLGSIFIALAVALWLAKGVALRGAETDQEKIAPLVVWLSFFSGSIISPFYEEIISRGVVYSSFRKRLEAQPAIWLSASCFALLHPEAAPRLLVYYTLTGALYAFLYERSRSLVPAITAHVTLNAVSLTSAQIPMALRVFPPVALLGIILVLIGLFVRLTIRYKELR